MHPSLESIAIAGAWGYIGRKFLDAAQILGLDTCVFDPGLSPADLGELTFERIDQVGPFYRRKADMFHLALHPQHRRLGLQLLLARSHREPILVLCEKPMAEPEQPEECQHVIDAVDQSQAVFLYDFPELYDPITQRLCEFLASFESVTIDSIHVQRSKDREDSGNPRNLKRMVTIQYQESVHCLAFVLHVLAHVSGGLSETLREGAAVVASAAPYNPPNPEAYPHSVDGKCEYRLSVGTATIEGKTDFKRGAEWAKRRVIRGRGDGRSFLIEADFLEDQKRLAINGVPQEDVIHTNSYVEVIRTLGRWRRQVPRDELMRGLYPNPRFAQIAYQLSSALWRSSYCQEKVTFNSLAELLAFDAGYTSAVSRLPHYRERGAN